MSTVSKQTAEATHRDVEFDLALAERLDHFLVKEGDVVQDRLASTGMNEGRGKALERLGVGIIAGPRANVGIVTH